MTGGRAAKEEARRRRVAGLWTAGLVDGEQATVLTDEKKRLDLDRQ
jgi:hypothetical protein